MTTYSIYLKGTTDEELKRSAQKRGITPLKLLKQRLKSGLKREQISALEMRLEAVLQLLELMIPEIGYTGGANRAASSNIAPAVQKGTETETNLRKSAAIIRARLEQKTSEVSL